MSTTQEIVDRLNEIEQADGQPGQNSSEIWAYIQALPEWDETKTDEVDPNQFGNAFALKTGEVIAWDESRKAWYERS